MNVAAAPLGVGFPQALNAANSINYTEGPNSNDPVDPVFVGAVTGLITVDGFESLEFANFEVLNIDAGAGSDEINLNHPGRPNELNDVNVSGGDPTAGSDVVVFNGSGVTETISVDQLTIDGAQIVTDANPNVTYVVGTAESLIVNGQGGGDIVSVTTPAGSDEITLSPGATIDAASIDIRDFNAVSLLPIRYEDIGDAGSLTLAMRVTATMFCSSMELILPTRSRSRQTAISLCSDPISGSPFPRMSQFQPLAWGKFRYGVTRVTTASTSSAIIPLGALADRVF